MESVIIHGKKFNLYLHNEQIIESIEKVAVKLNKDLQGKKPLFVVVLNGAFVFASELITRFNGSCDVAFVKLSSYEGMQSTSEVREIIGLEEEVKGRTIVFVEDIIDTGLTMMEAKKKMESSGAEDVLIATLLFKPNAFKFDYKIDYIGIEIPNDFIIGFGLDYDGDARNLRNIYKIEE